MFRCEVLLSVKEKEREGVRERRRKRKKKKETDFLEVELIPLMNGLRSKS